MQAGQEEAQDTDVQASPGQRGGGCASCEHLTANAVCYSVSQILLHAEVFFSFLAQWFPQLSPHQQISNPITQ